MTIKEIYCINDYMSPFLNYTSITNIKIIHTRDQRKCKICNSVEDESHFFFNCDITKKMIATFLNTLKKLTIILIFVIDV
jgi:hypothetical protein